MGGEVDKRLPFSNFCLDPYDVQSSQMERKKKKKKKWNARNEGKFRVLSDGRISETKKKFFFLVGSDPQRMAYQNIYKKYIFSNKKKKKLGFF